MRKHFSKHLTKNDIGILPFKLLNNLFLYFSTLLIWPNQWRYWNELVADSAHITAVLSIGVWSLSSAQNSSPLITFLGQKHSGQ